MEGRGHAFKKRHCDVPLGPARQPTLLLRSVPHSTNTVWVRTKKHGGLRTRSHTPSTPNLSAFLSPV
eukprot:scaffold5503_cov22-Tisochrysis_lutea.AAC.2